MRPISTKANWQSALLWSLIAAAFVGPGTVTTASRAGSEGGWFYLFPLLLAMLAGYLLMEMSARISLVTRRPFGAVVQQTFGKPMLILLFGGVFLGCAAYEAGNLLGGFAGIELIWDLDRPWVSLLVLLAMLVLWSGKVNHISKIMAVIVLLMGLVFLYTAVQTSFFSAQSIAGSNKKVEASTILALVGTSIVPYNFFLAASLSQEQQLGEMRRGLGLSFLMGGIITLGILLTASSLSDFQNFSELNSLLQANLGLAGSYLLALGLFAAGFSSAVTAPLAAALAAKTLFSTHTDTKPTNTASGIQTGDKPTRWIWLSVLLLGWLVASFNWDIVPLILAAQLVNGLLVPGLAALVIYISNQRALLGEQVNTIWQNLGGLLVFLYITYQSGNTISSKLAGSSSPSLSLFISLLLSLALFRSVTVKKRLA